MSYLRNPYVLAVLIALVALYLFPQLRSKLMGLVPGR